MPSTRGSAWCALLGLVGLGLAGYLVYLHLGLLRGELLGGPACGSGAFNCHAVTAGVWGTVLGVPLALWGILGYIVVIALALLGRQSPEWAARAMTLTALLAGLFVGVDLILLSLMVFVIRFYCLFCLLTYGVNLLLLIASVRSLPPPRAAAFRRLGEALASLVPSSQRSAAWMFWGIVLMGFFGTAALHASTTFVSRGTLGSMKRQIREFVTTQPRVQLDTAADPVNGPPTAPLRIVEFSDFLCPACQRASKLNIVMLASHRHDAQFIFKHFPLDTSCNDKIGRLLHPGACQVAAASECAHLQGKFWAFHDRMFELAGKPFNLDDIDKDPRLGLDLAQFQDCMAAGKGMEAVKRDIAEGAAIGVNSTPTYIINGLKIGGAMTPSTFEEFAEVLREGGY